MEQISKYLGINIQWMSTIEFLFGSFLVSMLMFVLGVLEVLAIDLIFFPLEC